MTAKMRAIRLDAVGPPENLALVEIDRPELTPDGILIRNAYAGMIYADAEARRGTYYRETKCPWFPGREAAGIVEAVGRDVRGIKRGERVAALVLAGGCYAEYVLARTAPQTGLRWPHGAAVRCRQAAARGELHAGARLPRQFPARASARARVGPAATRLEHRRSRCVRRHGIDDPPARARGSVARASRWSARTPRLEFCRRIGASHVVVTTRTDYVEEVRRLTGGAGATHSFNGVGGDTINRDPRMLAPFGELHCYGYVAGKVPFDLFATDRTLSIKTFNADNFLGTAELLRGDRGDASLVRLGPAARCRRGLPARSRRRRAPGHRSRHRARQDRPADMTPEIAVTQSARTGNWMRRMLWALLLIVLLAIGLWIASDRVYWDRYLHAHTLESFVEHPYPDARSAVSAGGGARCRLAARRSRSQSESERTIRADALAAAERYARSTKSTSLLVLHRGKLQYESYWEGSNAETPVYSFSMHKTIVGMMVGFAIADGKIGSVEDSVAKYLPEWSDPGALADPVEAPAADVERHRVDAVRRQPVLQAPAPADRHATSSIRR